MVVGSTTVQQRSRAPRRCQRARLAGLAALAAVGALSCPAPPPDEARPGPAVNWPTFHGTRARRGWNDLEAVLTPARVADPARFGPAWESEPFASLELEGRSFAPHSFASPLYVDDAATARGTLSVLIAATTNGDVYAVNAFARGGVRAGAIVWRTRVARAGRVADLDGGLPLGVLSTPVVDLAAPEPVVYVAARDADAGWQVHALALRDGGERAGWPLTLDPATISAANRNAPATFEDSAVLSQRGALALAPDGGRLYVPFGAYQDHGVGWLVAIDPRAPRVLATFSGGRGGAMEANGGIWSAGGVAVDDDGNVYATTGNGPASGEDVPGNWGQSLLRFDRDLALTGTFTPFNHCAMDVADTDLGGSSPVLVPDDAGAALFTVFGGKQGSLFLLDARHLPGPLDHRPPCSTDASTDASLLAPDAQPQFGTRGPLNVFGPYSERYGNRDHARMRSTPALYRDAQGATLVFVSGSAKASEDSEQSVPPCLARLRLVRPAGMPAASAYLAIDGVASEVACANPGSPVVTSQGPGGGSPVVWVLDANSRRDASLVDPATPRPVLYAFDGVTLRLLWRSDPGALALGGKYATPVIAHGRVFVATDRVQAFGAR